MEKPIRQIIIGVGVAGALAIVLFNFLRIPEILIVLGMFPLGLITAILALRQPEFYLQPITVGRLIKIGTVSGLVAVSPFLLFGCGHMIWTQLPVNSNTAIAAMGPLLGIIIYILSGIGVLLSAVGGGLGRLWARGLPNSSVDLKNEIGVENKRS